MTGKQILYDGDDPPYPHWYAIHTGARQELIALRNLKRAGYWTFHAFTRVRRARKIPGKSGKRIEWIERPHFNRYVFVALRQPSETLDAIRSLNPNTGIGMEGISTVVRIPRTGQPLRIPHAEMDKIFEYASVRFVDGDKFIAALIEQIILDEGHVTRLFIDRNKKRAIVTEPREVA